MSAAAGMRYESFIFKIYYGYKGLQNECPSQVPDLFSDPTPTVMTVSEMGKLTGSPGSWWG